MVPIGNLRAGDAAGHPADVPAAGADRTGHASSADARAVWNWTKKTLRCALSSVPASTSMDPLLRRILAQIEKEG